MVGRSRRVVSSTVDGRWGADNGESRRLDGRAQRSRGVRSDHEKTLLLGGRVKGHVQLYGERGKGGGGGKRRDGHRKNQEGSRASGVAGKHLSLHRCCLPDETTDSRPGGNLRNSRGKSSVGRRHAPVHQLVMPANETTDSRPPRGAPSPSPPHPHPSQVPPAECN